MSRAPVRSPVRAPALCRAGVPGGMWPNDLAAPAKRFAA